MAPHRVVIVGGGFGGLEAARRLGRAAVQVTLVDRRNFHLFQPLLYQVATGGLSPANIAAPLRSILKRNANTHVLLAEVTGFDVAARKVQLRDGELDYDTLIVAAGSTHSYFGRDDWEPLAPGLKTVEDATEIRRRVLLAFEAAEREIDPRRRAAWLTFIIVGGGPTGVEMAGAISEIARRTLKDDFRNINPADAKVIVVEAGPRVLGPFTEYLSQTAERALERLDVVVRTNTRVTDVAPDHVRLTSGDATEIVEAHTVVWAAGVRASPLAAALASATGQELDRAGRIAVQADLTLGGHPEIFVLGDMALAKDEQGKPLPGLAPVAIQGGRYAAKLIQARLAGNPVPGPFRYKDHGTMATIGRRSAVAQVFGRQLKGFIAWVMWLFVHLMLIVQFENRLLILMQWGWNYITFNRSARLITGATPPLLSEHATTVKEASPASSGERPAASSAERAG